MTAGDRDNSGNLSGHSVRRPRRSPSLVGGRPWACSRQTCQPGRSPLAAVEVRCGRRATADGRMDCRTAAASDAADGRPRGPAGGCRRNLKPAKRRLRSSPHTNAWASVWLRRGLWRDGGGWAWGLLFIVLRCLRNPRAAPSPRPLSPAAALVSTHPRSFCSVIEQRSPERGFAVDDSMLPRAGSTWAIESRPCRGCEATSSPDTTMCRYHRHGASGARRTSHRPQFWSCRQVYGLLRSARVSRPRRGDDPRRSPPLTTRRSAARNCPPPIPSLPPAAPGFLTIPFLLPRSPGRCDQGTTYPAQADTSQSASAD